MGTRNQVMDWLRETFGFGRILASVLGSSTNTVGVHVEGDEDEASADDEDLWGHAPLLYRPVEPDATGHCEALFYRLGDEKVVFATKDRRFQIAVQEGEVVITAMGPSAPAYIHLKPDGNVIVRGSAINLGGAATQFVALANLVLDELQDVKADLEGFKSTFDAHTHAGAFGGTGSAPAITSPPSASPTGLPATTFPAPHTPGSVACTKTKSE